MRCVLSSCITRSLCLLACTEVLTLLVLLPTAMFVFKQKTAYEMRISDWSSDVCSSDLRPQDHITLEMAPLEIRHRSVRPISAKHAQASRFLQQSPAAGMAGMNDHDGD